MSFIISLTKIGDRRSHHRLVVIQSVPITTNIVSSNQCFFLGTLVSSINKTDRHNITLTMVNDCLTPSE
jgi:hypothetical protein